MAKVIKQSMVLTSVKVEEGQFAQFKVECVRDKFTLHNLVNKCIKLYLTDESFRKAIIKYGEK
jgi:hypothetical protein